MEVGKQKHRFYSMVIMAFISIVSIQLLIDDGWFMQGDATFVNIIVGLLIGAFFTTLIGAFKELIYDSAMGKGDASWGDMIANWKGIGRGAAIVIVLILIIELVNLF